MKSCKWHGVECDGAGHVVSLQLDDESISGGIGDSSSLLRLKYVEKLNLAYNDFNSSVIPKGIKHLKYLTHLNLSYAGFSGQLPLEISLLRRLVSLDISTDFDNEPPKLEDPNLVMLLENLTRLRELYLDGMYISFDERENWSHIISSYLPNITTLSLRICSLYGPLSTSFGKLHSLSVLRLDGNDLSTASPGLFTNFSSLTTLSLASCGLKGSFPDKIFQTPTLQHLDLSDNQLLSGSLPPFPHSGSLESIWLSYTNFSGSIPSSIGNLKTLSEIDLGGCRFGGPIPSTFANLTQLTHVDLSSNFFTGSVSPAMFESFSNLIYLNLGINSRTGNIPDSLFHLPSLQRLYLNNNNFTGVIEEFPIVNVSKIVRLYLGNNRLEGPIPNSFFQLQSLEYVILGDNLFNGSFQLEKIQSFANLTQLDLSGNNLSVYVKNDNWSSYGLPMLAKLSLRSCNMHEFPHFLKQYSNQLQQLDLSNNRISGEIPNWIWGTQLDYLNISFNLLTHVQKPFNIPPSLMSLDLQSNQLREQLHLPIPPNITPDLQYLSLRNNSLSGTIPASLCTATKLLALDLSVNQLSGTIPSCLLDGTVALYVLDLGRNNISGHILDNFGTNCSLLYFDLSNNTLEGMIPKSLGSCGFLELMNGEIPQGRQLQTFPADSFIGNPGLCGFNLNISCIVHTDDGSDESEKEKKGEIEWEYVSAALGYGVGLGSFVWVLIFCRIFRYIYFGKIDEVAEDIFNAIDRRRRRRSHARRVERNRVRMRSQFY